MPRPRFATADADLRRRILDAATKEFATKGYGAASLNRILLAAGLSKGSFYYYFDDKADLAASVLAAWMEGMRPLSTALGTPKDPDEFWLAIRQFTERTMDERLSSQQSLDLIGKLGMAFVDHPEIAERVMPAIGGYVSDMVAFFTHGQAIGAVRRDLPAPVLMSLIQSTKTALASSLLPRRALTRAELAQFNEVFMELVLRMVKP
jgi:AcrR family transcriptional regulator